MLILLFVIFTVLLILGSVFIDEYDHEFLQTAVQVFAAVGMVVVVILFAGCVFDLSETMVIDDKIAMYTEENQKIESQIDLIVREYMDYESNTFTELKSDSSIMLVSLFPELKADELVQVQIATYQANNAKLKELKETKINTRVYKWWLYFGK